MSSPQPTDPKSTTSWDPRWEEVFQTRAWGRYPPEELVRFIARSFFKVSRRNDTRILELGCGPGANLWFMAREGFDVYGIDGSNTAIEVAKGRMAQDGLKANLHVGDIVELSDVFCAESFDAVVDVCCLQHNKIGVVRSVLRQTQRVLKPGGRMFSIMIGSGSWGDKLGTELEPGTMTEITDGPLKGVGLSHFFSLDEVQSLFDDLFSEVNIEYSNRSLGGRKYELRHWLIEATKQL